MAKGHQSDQAPPPEAPDEDVRAVRRKAEATLVPADPVVNRTQNPAADHRGTAVRAIARIDRLATEEAAAGATEAPVVAARAIPAADLGPGVTMGLAASAPVALGGSRVLAAARVARAPGARILAVSADPAIAANPAVAHARAGRVVVAAETTIAAEMTVVTARRPVVSLAAAAGHGAPTVRRVPAGATRTRLGATAGGQRLGAAIVKVAPRGHAMARATTRVPPRGVRRRAGVQMSMAARGATDLIRIARRSGARHIAPDPVLPGNRAANRAARGWSFLRISIFNSSRAACERSCAA